MTDRDRARTIAVRALALAAWLVVLALFIATTGHRPEVVAIAATALVAYALLTYLGSRS